MSTQKTGRSFCDLSALLGIASDWSSTVSFSHSTSESLLSSDVCGFLSSISRGQFAVDESSMGMARIFASHCSSVERQAPSKVTSFLKLASDFVVRVCQLHLNPVLVSGMLEKMHMFILELDSRTTSSTIDIANVERFAEEMLQGVPQGARIAHAVRKCVALCLEGSSFFPGRICVLSSRCQTESIVPGLVLDRSITSLLRHSCPTFPARVILFSCGISEESCLDILSIVQRLGVGVLASQRVVSEDIKFLLAECGVLTMDRLSIHSVHPFALATGARILGSLSEVDLFSKCMGTIVSMDTFDSHMCRIHGPTQHCFYSLVIPLRGSRCYSRLVRECFHACVEMSASRMCFSGNRIFEAKFLTEIEQAATESGWSPVVSPLIASLDHLHGWLWQGCRCAGDKETSNFLEPQTVTMSLISETLLLSSALFRMRGSSL